MTTDGGVGGVTDNSEYTNNTCTTVMPGEPVIVA